MGESAADVMMKLKAMKQAKQKAASNGGGGGASKAVKRKTASSAEDVMTQLRQLKEKKQKLNNSSPSKQKNIRIVDPEEEDDSINEDDFSNDDDDDDDYDGELDGKDHDDEFTGFDGDLQKSRQPRETGSDDEGPVIVRFNGTKTEQVHVPTPRERKSFMSEKAPKSELALEAEKKKLQRMKLRNQVDDDDDNNDNLKHDVELQRLITESHILSEASTKTKSLSSSSNFFSFNPIGKVRLKTLDARIESLALQSGGKNKSNKKDYYSVNPKSLIEIKEKKFNKEKLSMRMRKGMVSKQAERKHKYEERAKDAGIVLPIATGSKKSGRTDRRDRGLKLQSVGRHTKSGLQISKAEIARIKRL
ncbi:hypothetical protein V1514DRAFT_362042 [Lipomyces japonicus]|uniref:uncharacterized protein n=1 Tax=Lipomyces japonicus TaxID=56871 RepID=UPI0034CD93C5